MVPILMGRINEIMAKTFKESPASDGLSMSGKQRR